MKFTKDFLIAALEDGPPIVIRDRITDTGRWSVHHELIFTHEGKFYRTSYSVGATECQDERPWEYDGEYIECQLVEPYEVTKTAYRAVREAS